MRFLHTGDWHIGRGVRGRSRQSEHAAALQQVLGHAHEQRVDCLLLAGDVFDSAAPPPEAERLVYDFFSELHGLGIPAVVIAGNHDHPHRFDAIAPVLRSLRIRVVGEPVIGDHAGVVEVDSRAGTERAVVAALPWVSERRAVAFGQLAKGPAASIIAYADQLRRALAELATAFRPDTANVLVAHLLVNDALVGPGGGERALHMDMGIYGLNPEALPQAAQYTALGHVHRPQAVRESPAAWYPGSLLQLDFGEQRQEKFVNLVEVHPGLPADVAQLPITAGRPLLDVGSQLHGARIEDLPDYIERAQGAWVRVFVDVQTPIADLASQVREVLPDAVHVQPVRPPAPDAQRPRLSGLGPQELFATYYRSDRGHEPGAEMLGLLRELLEEEASETTPA